EIDLVIPDANVVIGVAVDEQYLNFAGESADLVELASSANGGPQTCESATEYEDARHLVHPERSPSEKLALLKRPQLASPARGGKLRQAAGLGLGGIEVVLISER